MSQKQRDEINVRWVDTTTGEDFTDLMNDPSIPPGEGILELARALARFAAARDIEAQRQLLQAVQIELQVTPEEPSPLRTPEVGEELLLAGVRYKYDGSTADGEHFTRLKGANCEEALVSLRRGSAAASWMLRRLTPRQ